MSEACRIDKARTAVEKFGGRGHPGRGVCAARLWSARQHTIEIRLLTLNVKLASADKKQGLDVQGPAQSQTVTRTVQLLFVERQEGS